MWKIITQKVQIEGYLWVAVVLGSRILTIEVNVLTSHLIICIRLGCQLLGESHHYPSTFIQIVTKHYFIHKGFSDEISDKFALKFSLIVMQLNVGLLQNATKHSFMLIK